MKRSVLVVWGDNLTNCFENGRTVSGCITLRVSSAQSVRGTSLKSSGNKHAEQQLFGSNRPALGHLHTLVSTPRALRSENSFLKGLSSL